MTDPSLGNLTDGNQPSTKQVNWAIIIRELKVSNTVNHIQSWWKNLCLFYRTIKFSLLIYFISLSL